MKLSANGRTVLERRYLKKKNEKPVETPEDMLRRVAENIAAVEEEYGKSSAEKEKWAELFFHVMDERKFLPNSPTLMNAGRELQQLAACFVLPVEDSMESIYETLKVAALIHKSGGGTGFAFSRIRPKNDQVGSTGGVASGPLSFLKVYNASTEAVKQGGARRGANMGILRVDHPDIKDFIRAKCGTGEYKNFNLSVAVTDTFMEKVAKGETFPLLNPRTNAPIGQVNARELFAEIVESAWASGEPGVIFIDRINEYNPTPALGPIESTNPCGEQPLLPYEACTLGSINLSLMFREENGVPEIDWDELKRVTHLGVRFLDNVIDASCYPVPQIEKNVKANRKIGLGVMGWAEMLIKKGIPYDSEEALNLAKEVMSFIDRESKAASAHLAEERGVFPNFTGSIYDRPGLPGLRNATTTTIAPTGSISIIADASGGIEPLFSLAFTRQILDNDRLLEVNSLFREVAEKKGFYSPALAEELAEKGSLDELDEVPPEIKKVFVTAHQISPEWHIRMQAAFQEFTDNAVSKTVNFPQSASKDEVSAVYHLAYQLKCKGVTVYRDGCLENQPMQKGVTAPEQKPAPAATEPKWGKLRPLPRPVRLTGITDSKRTPEGTLYLTLNLHNGQPFELFAQIGKAGSDIMAFTEGIARLVSLAFRCGIDPAGVAEQLLGIGGSRSVGFGPHRVRSVPDAIGRFISEYLQNFDSRTTRTTPVQENLSFPPPGRDPSSGNKEFPNKNKKKLSFNLCPSCGIYAFAWMEGCGKCLACGHAEC